jgi:hypothetical protein
MSTSPTPLDEALDRHGPGPVEVETPGGRARLEVEEVDRLGVRLRGVVVRRQEPFDVAEEAARLPERLRPLPEPVEVVEVAPELGHAVLRSRPEEPGAGDFFEVEVRGAREIDVRRWRLDESGQREPADFTMTRQGVGRLLGGMGGG